MTNSDNATSYWNFGDKREDAIHRIHSYPARFPAFITTKALCYAEQRGVRVKVVADVFCGCGTTAVEAKRSGKNFWGCDINPVATLIAQVKTHHYRDTVLVRYFEAIQDEFRHTKVSRKEQAQVNDRIQYWFNKRNINDLLRLNKAIQRRVPASSPHQKFFLCGFSNILKPTSRWLTKSIKSQQDPDKLPRGVMDAFENQFALMRHANQGNRFPCTTGQKTCIRTCDFLAPTEPDSRADLIVTSPPYVTSYDYAEIHQLSILWLGYASDYRDLRENMLGNQRGVESPDAVSISTLGPIGEKTYQSLLKKDQNKARSVARYFLDMNEAVGKCERMLNSGGMAVFVIGNTQYKGVRIDNREHLKHCMEHAGFIDVNAISRRISRKTIPPHRDACGRFTRNTAARKVYGEEFVVIGRKP